MATFFIPQKENVEHFKTVSVYFTLASKIDNCKAVKISSNLITTNLFNPDCEIFSINLQNPYVYLNKQFQCLRLPLNDNYLDYISFELNFILNENNHLILKPLEFTIELEFNEN